MCHKNNMYPTLAAIFFLLQTPSNLTSENADISKVFDQDVFKLSQIFAEILCVINNRYYQNVDLKKPMFNAFKALFNTLDSHSTFMDAESFEQIKNTTQGEFAGVGIQIDNTKDADDDFLRVIDTIPGGPADKIGIKPDDKIIQIDNEIVKGLNIEEIIAKLKGKKNTVVHLKILRSDTSRLLSFDVVRDIVKEQNAICYYFKNHNIYYLSLNMFTENSIQQVEHLLKKISSHNAKGCILDLRNNSGGLLNAVIDIASLFLDKGSLIVQIKNKNNEIIKSYATQKDPIANKQVPIFILVNNYTASAAEILAGCLQFYAKEGKLSAYILGSNTFGKGSVQEVIPIGDDCAAKLTIALYALPDNVLLQGVGVKPDFAIEPRFSASQEITWFNNFFGRESSLKNTIKLQHAKKHKSSGSLKDKSPEKPVKKATEKTWHEKKQEAISSDYMILSALRLLEMLNLAKKAYPQQTKKHQACIELLTQLYAPQETNDLEEIKV